MMNETPTTTEASSAGSTPVKKWYHLTPLEWAVLIAIIVVITLLLIPSVQRATGGGRRERCRHNLKMIGLALHNYHDQYGSFPPAYIADADGKPMHSWRVLILSYLDAQKLYDEYHFDEPWNGPHNITLQDRIPQVYRCPTYQHQLQERQLDSEYSRRLTNYVLIDGPTAIFDGTHAPKLNEITDGTDKTIMVADVKNHAVHWMQPDDITPDELITELLFSADEDHALHPQGLQVGFANGAARFLSCETHIETVRALITKDRSDTVGDDF